MELDLIFDPESHVSLELSFCGADGTGGGRFARLSPVASSLDTSVNAERLRDGTAFTAGGVGSTVFATPFVGKSTLATQLVGTRFPCSILHMLLGCSRMAVQHLDREATLVCPVSCDVRVGCTPDLMVRRTLWLVYLP